MAQLWRSLCRAFASKWTYQDRGIIGGVMTNHPVEGDALLTPAEVAALFRVDPKTVTRWARAGKLTSLRTLGGHRRYRESEVRALLGGDNIAS
jgi:excisionase family DNA binding protein